MSRDNFLSPNTYKHLADNGCLILIRHRHVTLYGIVKGRSKYHGRSSGSRFSTEGEMNFGMKSKTEAPKLTKTVMCIQLTTHP
jgi:hypothetical protein